MILRIPKAVIQNQRLSFGLILFISACFSVMLLFFSLNKFDILSAKFFSDHASILKAGLTATEWSTTGFLNTGLLYQKLGLIDSVTNTVLFSFIVCLGSFAYLLFKAPVLDSSALIFTLLIYGF